MKGKQQFFSVILSRFRLNPWLKKMTRDPPTGRWTDPHIETHMKINTNHETKIKHIFFQGMGGGEEVLTR